MLSTISDIKYQRDTKLSPPSPPPLHDSFWNNACQQPTLAINYQHYAKVVSDSTTQLKQCIQDMLNTLNNRAIGLTLCANFDAALRDASALQQLSPSSARGYLREANIYSEQGKQRAVIDICNKGLKVADKHDPDYAKLQEAKVNAEQRVTKRIDFISQLPLEILVTTLMPMLMADNGEAMDSITLCSYLDVCKIWRNRVYQACEGGFHFKVDDEKSITCKQVMRFAQHTRALRIEPYSKGKRIPDLLCNANLRSLQEITIDGIHVDCNTDLLVSSLRLVGITLTRLIITWRFITPDQRPKFGPFRSPVRVAHILMKCPQLTLLQMDFPFNLDFRAVPEIATFPQLETLHLSEPNTLNLNVSYQAVLKRLPSLKKLVLRPCTEPRAIAMIQHYCPFIRDLELSMEISYDIQPRTEQRKDQVLRMKGGLKKLVISDYSRSGYVSVDICNMLKQNHSTVVELDLTVNNGGIHHHGLYTLQYPSLKTLNLACYGRLDDCFGWWIVGTAPFLEKLIIRSSVLETNPTILDIPPPPNLKKLILDISTRTHLDKDPTIPERYLNHFVQHETLKELDVRFSTDYDDNSPILGVICRMKQLERFDFTPPYYWTQLEMEEFSEMLVQGCPNLISFEIKCGYPPSVTTIDNLKRLEHLQHFAFPLTHSDYSSFWDSLRTFSQLNVIRAIKVSTIPSHSFTDYMKRARPNIKVLVVDEF